MKYCNKCFYPETKPDLWFNDEGTCSACLSFAEREKIDWKAREAMFLGMVADIKRHRDHNSTYDCIVPVSGGKDSHYQVIKCLEVGLHPLAVYATTDDITPLGRKNVQNIATLCDLVEVNVNQTVRRKIAKYALQTIGDISWAEHITIFTIPFREAALRNIRYIIYGENSQNEYGGPPDAAEANTLTQRWLSEFGGLNGLRTFDLVRKGILDQKHYQYFHPSKTDATALFLGHYYPWDGRENALIAARHGFTMNPYRVEGNGSHYENLDNYQTGIHDFFKYIKFGFGRATDIANNLLRREYITRHEALEYIEEWDGFYQDNRAGIFTYLGKPRADIIRDINMTNEEFKIASHKFVNRDLFEVDEENDTFVPKFELPKE